MYEKELTDFVEQLKKKCHPEKVILFGSMAHGHPTLDSDIDLVIIKKTRKRYIERAKEIIDSCDYQIPIQFFIYTPEEFEFESKHNPFVRSEIIAKGKVLYEAKA